MPQNETKHKLKITADARDVRQATKGLGQDLKDLTLKQVQLARSMKDVKQGTEQYKKLKYELKGVAEQTKLASDALRRLDQVQQRSHREQTQRQRESLQQQKQQVQNIRGQSLAAGLAQGAGIAQYIPTGPGMAARMGGAAIGGMARRAVGGAAAPIAMPGIAGMQSMLQAIPFVGAPMAGALAMRAQMFQQAVGFSRAQAGAAAYGGGPSPFEMGPAIAKAAAIRRRGAVKAAMITPRMVALTARQAARRTEEFGGGRGEITFEDPRAAAIQAAVRQFSPEGPGAPLEMPATMVKRGAGGELSVGRNVAEEKKLQKRQERIINAANKEAARETRVQMPGAMMGARFGLGPNQMMESFGGFMQARGGVFTGGARQQFEESLAARAGFGVTAETAGGFARQRGLGGGLRAGAGMAQVLQSAVAQGLRGSRAVEYLQELVSLSVIAEKRGVKIDATDFTRQTAQITAAGIAAPQAQRITGGLSRRAMDISERGVQSPADLAMLRAAGFDPKGGRMSYIRAVNKLEGGMTPDMLGNLMGMVTQSFGEGGNLEEQAFHLKRLFGRGFGVSVGAGQATNLLQAYQGGASTTEMMQQYETMVSKGESAGARKRMIEGAAGRVPGLAKRAARIEAENIKLGREMADTFIKIDNSGRNLAKTMGSFDTQLNKIATSITKFTEELSKGNYLEAFKKLAGALTSPGKKDAPNTKR